MTTRESWVGTLGTLTFVLVGCGGGGDGEPPTQPPNDEIVSVTVEADPSVPVENGTPTIEVGETADFDATARDGQGDPVPTTFTWSSLEPAVATVDGSGTATGQDTGTARIVARAENGVSDTADLAVKDSIGETATVTVTPARDTVRIGESVTFEAAAEDADGDSVPTPFTWTSLDTMVATVDANGTATGRDPGEAGIVAEAENGVSDTATLVVRDTADTQPDDEPPTATIQEPSDGSTFSQGSSITFRGEATDPEQGSLPDDDLVWESDLDGELGRGEEIQATLTEGSHVVSFTATDSAGQSAADSIDVTVEGPDLVAASIDLLARGVLTSATAGGELLVRNDGSDAGAYRWSLSEGGMELTSGQRDGLAAGAVDTIPFSGLGPFPAGAHDFTFEVDTEGAVDESDEGNNTTSARLESRPEGFTMEIRFVGSVSEQLREEVLAERDRWERALTGDLRDVSVDSLDVEQCFRETVGLDPITETIDDLLVYVRSDSIDGSPSEGNTLAQAGPCFVRLDDADLELPPLPLVGSVTIDTADVETLRSLGILSDVILHELAHTLGFSGFMWEFQGGVGDDVGPHQLVEGADTADPRFIGPLAARQFQEVGGDATDVPVESGGGSGTAGSHWRETVFGNELMTGFINLGDNPLSVVTIGSFGDMFYAVDLGEADFYTLPGSSGVVAAGSGNMELEESVLRPLYGVDLSGRVWRLEGGRRIPTDPQEGGR